MNRKQPSRVEQGFADDMVEVESDLPAHSGLRKAVNFASETLLERYRRADRGAIHQQAWHRRMAALAALLGTLAVVVAIIQLSELIPGPMPRNVEITAVVVSLAAVGLGATLAFQRRWLLERHKAERGRLLKFAFLTNPEFWCAAPAGQAQRQTQLEQDAEAVCNLLPHNMEHWFRADLAAESPAVRMNCATDDGTLRAVVEYYRKRRLGNQINFFSDRCARDEARQKLTWRFPSWLFFASIAAALLHFVLDLQHHETTRSNDVGREASITNADTQNAKSEGDHAGNGEKTKTVSVLLIVLAAGLPALGAGIRTYRSTYEFARNAMRYEAKLLALRRLDESLAAELAAGPMNARRTFHHLWCCEQVLELEHREWLRLMIEAEWYG